MKNLCLYVFVCGLFLISSNAQSGVLIPTSTNKPDEKILALQRMDVDIVIDNNHANVKIVQIFSNRTADTLEGKYLFALPSNSLIFDFATWDNDVRIPGVMMEKRDANSIYAQLKAPKIDPAILQQDAETAAFSAKVFPINPFGTKRLELEYTEDLEIENGISTFAFPLKAPAGEVQNAGELNISLRVISDLFIQPFETKGFALEVIKSFPSEFEARFHSENVALSEDVSFAYKLQNNENSLAFLTHRSPEKISAYDLRDPKLANPNPDGYFEVRPIFNRENLPNAQPKRVIILLDTSLSMYGDKLTRAVEATDYFLHNLTEADQFNLISFNDETKTFAENPVWATSEIVERAMQFVKNEALGGGTNLNIGLQTAIAQAKLLDDSSGTIALISDANPTLETTKSNRIAEVFGGSNAKLFAFAIGTDSNELLLKELCSKTKGKLFQARETADISTQLKIFFDNLADSRNL
jgi:Ca-activated chloride channel homolog